MPSWKDVTPTATVHDHPKKRHVNHVVILLDETGSMQDIREETVVGMNKFIDGLREDKGDHVLLTLVKFDTSHYTPMYQATPISDVRPLTLNDYRPGLNTNLYDSIGRIVTDVDESKADSILCVIMTDGADNSSREWTLVKVKSLIEEKQEQREKPWLFTFLGADINAYATGSTLGLATGSTVSYHKSNTGNVFRGLAESQGNWRSSNVAGQGATSDNFYAAGTKAKMEEKKDKSS